MRKWHKGPPPHIGWWNASALRAHCSWRWWNGSCWSFVVDCTWTSEVAAERATIRSLIRNIEWSDYYPKNARVKRIKP